MPHGPHARLTLCYKRDGGVVSKKDIKEVLYTINQEIILRRELEFYYKRYHNKQREREELGWWLRGSTHNKRAEVQVLLPLNARREDYVLLSRKRRAVTL